MEHLTCRIVFVVSLTVFVPHFCKYVSLTTTIAKGVPQNVLLVVLDDFLQPQNLSKERTCSRNDVISGERLGLRSIGVSNVCVCVFLVGELRLEHLLYVRVGLS